MDLLFFYVPSSLCHLIFYVRVQEHFFLIRIQVFDVPLKQKWSVIHLFFMIVMTSLPSMC